MVRELGLQRSLQDCFGELFQQAVLADDVFRLLVIGQQLINERLVDSHRFLILLFRWSFTQLLLQLRKASTALLEQGIQTPSPAPDLIPAETSTENLHWHWYSKRGHFNSTVVARNGVRMPVILFSAVPN